MRPAILIPMLSVLALLPAAPALAGCGGCQSAAPVLYAQPQIAPVLYAQPRPVPVYAWPQSYSSCGGCRSSSYRAVDVVDTQPRFVKQPIYVVNQGPHYSGSGIMVSTSTWSKGGYAGDYPYADGQPGAYDGGPYADPMGPGYVRRYGYHEQVPAGYVDAPHGPRLITNRYAPRYSPAYTSRRSPRVYAPPHRPVVVRANAEVRHLGANRIDVRLYRSTPAKRRYHGY